MPYCTQCGAEIQPGDSFCTSCGAPVEEITDVEAAEGDTGTSSEQPAAETTTGDDQSPAAPTSQLGSGTGTTTPTAESDRSLSTDQIDGSDAVDLLGRGWTFLSNNPAAFGVFAVAGAIQLIGGLAGGAIQGIFGIVAGIVVAIGGGVVIYGIPTVAAGNRFDLERLVQRTLGRLLVAIVAGIIWAVLVGIGLLLLVVPGIYLMLKFAFFAQYVYLAESGPIEALQNSWARTQGLLVPIFIVLVAIAIPSAILGFVPVIGRPIATTVVTPIGIAALTHLYLDLEGEESETPIRTKTTN